MRETVKRIIDRDWQPRMLMKRTFASFLLCLMLATPAGAGYDEGMQAHTQRCDYQTAMREWRPLAQQGIMSPERSWRHLAEDVYPPVGDFSVIGKADQVTQVLTGGPVSTPMALEGNVLHSEMLHWHGIQTSVS